MIQPTQTQETRANKEPRLCVVRHCEALIGRATRVKSGRKGSLLAVGLMAVMLIATNLFWGTGTIGSKYLRLDQFYRIYQLVIDNSEDTATMNANDSQNSKILTVQEVADILRVHRSTISRYAMSGELKSYVIGNRRLFKETEVWAFFENRIATESQVDQRCVFGKEN